MEISDYRTARKTVTLVERNPTPNGANIVSMSRIFAHDESDIIALAKQIQSADESLKHNACGKLSLILEQIKMLQDQAKKILEETNESNQLHHVACNFQKKPGHIYHLYTRESGQKYFSMLSPEEWGNSNNHNYEGSYRLEYDSSWTPINDIKKKDEMRIAAQKLLSGSSFNTNLAIEDKPNTDL